MCKKLFEGGNAPPPPKKIIIEIPQLKQLVHIFTSQGKILPSFITIQRIV